MTRIWIDAVIMGFCLLITVLFLIGVQMVWEVS